VAVCYGSGVLAPLASLLVPRFFDMFVIGASAVGGAAMVMTGANHIFHGVGVFNLAAGGVLPSLVTIILGLGGVSWQRSNITKWVQMEPTNRDV
jgi:hypothetical protein